MSLRIARDVLVLLVLALLPWAAGCAATAASYARPAADGTSQGRRPGFGALPQLPRVGDHVGISR